ncbi:DNA (cytosine-5-)-methyltransferase [Morganella phage vB_Mm5]
MNELFYGSVCSGIEAASVAWEPLGWKPSWFSEIEDFPSAVLNYHWPDIVNLGDMTTIPDLVKSEQVFAPDILVGGTPCQAFSINGLRKGLDDDRGKLTLSFIKIADQIDEIRRKYGKPECITVWENVPGVLTSKDNAFGYFLAGLAGEDIELKPTGKRWSNAGFVFGTKRNVAWRVLDAKYFGVPQQRSRIFVISSARKDISIERILFEQTGVSGCSPQELKSRCENTWDLEINTPEHNSQVVSRFLSFGEYVRSAYSSTLKAKHSCTVCDFIVENGRVRMYTPLESERLQGFPDNHTKIPYKGKSIDMCPTGHRYHAIGNSIAVPVMSWIGKRIQDELTHK